VRPFLIISAPRSRSFWTSTLLRCEHDPSRNWPDMKWGAFFTDGKNGVDTAVMNFDSVVAGLHSDGVRMATLRRPAQEIAESLVSLGIARHIAEPASVLGCARLDMFEDAYSLPRFSSDACSDYDEASRLFRWCRGERLSREIWRTLSGTHLETPLLAPYRRAAA